MARKNRGIMIIEVLVALMILIIASMMAMTSTIAVNKSKIKRDMYGELDRISYCIMNEIKYNYSIEDIKKEMLINNIGVENKNHIGFKYTDDILDKLTTINLFDLENGTDIDVDIINNNEFEEIVKMKIQIKVHIGGDEIYVERVFNKSWWME